MPSSNKDKKKRIFDLFSQNLEWVKEHPEISFKPDFTNGYVCPLCFTVFEEKDLDQSQDNPLTFEDVPPKSLGGRPLTLTCKSCNSKSGHTLDIHILRRLLEIDAKALLPNSSSPITLEHEGNTVNAAMEMDENRQLRINLLPQHSNPDQASGFMSDVFPPRYTVYSPLFNSDEEPRQFESPSFNMRFREKANERRAEVALLRIAYLMAYSTLGNGFLINAGLYKVREQLQNPDKEILPGVFWMKYDFPKEHEGINIITQPDELRCFLVIFRLKTKSISRQFAIALPGTSDPGLGIYQNIIDELCTEDGTKDINVTLEHIPNEDYLKKKNLAFASHIYWQEYTSDQYQPRFPPKDKG